MEDLNKTQLILLTLLVSFVTSIATGIITVSLLQEAPANVTQTVNRVVEKTIERVVPDESGGGESIREVTVVVNEEDLVIDAISMNSKVIVRIRDNALVNGVSQFYGIGFLVNKNGLIVSARRDTLNPGSTYTATFQDGSTFSMKVIGVDDVGNLAFFQTPEDSRTSLPSEPVKLGTSDPKLGQTVIMIEGQDKDVITIGRVSSFVFTDPSASADDQSPLRINTDVTAKTQVVGSPIVNLSGEIVGVRVGAAEGSTISFTPLSILRQALTAQTP
jgi:hypothetical protein